MTINDRLHIAHYTNFYHPIVNGVVHSVSLYRKTLTSLGHNVFVFAQHAADYEDEEPFIFRYPAVPISRESDMSAAIPIAPHLDRILPSLKLDVIHTHHPFLLGQVAANKAEELDIPLVFTFHTRYRDYTHYFPLPVDFVQDFIKTAVDTWMGDFMVKCHHIIVPSQSMKDILESGYGLVDSVTVIPTGIELEPYQKADREATRKRYRWNNNRILISVGRMAHEKNIETLLKAAAIAMEHHDDLRLVLVGDGPARNDLGVLAKKLGIAPNVKFIGKVPFKEIPSLLKAADIFGFASITETQGLVTMEALAAGLPVAAVDASGTRDVVTHGVEGLLTDNDPAALAEAICTIIDQPERIEAFRAAAENKARQYDLRYLAQKMVEVYAQAKEDCRSGKKVKLIKPKLFNIDWKLFPTL